MLGWLVTASAPALAAQTLARVAIIIDDLGYRRAEGERALALPGRLTYAVLPHTPYAKEFAVDAHARNKEVMLHLPMESERGHALGPGGITSHMGRKEVVDTLTTNLDAIPHLRGVSNHMGSLLSASEEPVDWLMAAVKARGESLFFVDSRTTPRSVIARIAARHGVPNITRDVFLDNKLDVDEIRHQFALLMSRAISHGSALGIAHPHPQTLQVLEQLLPGMKSIGVELVPVSELIAIRKHGSGAVALKTTAQSSSF